MRVSYYDYVIRMDSAYNYLQYIVPQYTENLPIIFYGQTKIVRANHQHINT